MGRKIFDMGRSLTGKGGGTIAIQQLGLLRSESIYDDYFDEFQRKIFSALGFPELERRRRRMAEKVQNLAEGLRDELRRCRELKEQYIKIGPAGAFGATMIEQSIRAAEDAQANNDVIQMMVCYEKLKGHE